jgi:membrane fusion protein, multidrug efflux system
MQSSLLNRAGPRLLLAMTLALPGCAKQSSQVAFPTPEVGVVTVRTQSVALTSELPGRTTPSLIADVRPQVAGIVKARLFEEGAHVTAGQVLYQIDPATYQAAYDQAKADLENSASSVAAARSKDERYKELLTIQGVSQQDADDAHATYQQSVASVALKKAALQSALINLEYTKVRAPISGRIGKSSVTPGALVTASQDTALATIRSLDPIYVDLAQSSSQLLQLRKLLGAQGTRPGDRTVRLKLEDASEYAWPGVLKFQEVAVDTSTGSVTLRAQFPNPDGVLLPGMYVEAVLSEAVNTVAVLAPQQAISRDPKGNAFALVVGTNGRVEQRAVDADRTIGSDWLIQKGLAAGDRLIVEGAGKVRVGDLVHAVALNQSPADTRSANATAPGSGHNQ